MRRQSLSLTPADLDLVARTDRTRQAALNNNAGTTGSEASQSLGFVLKPIGSRGILEEAEYEERKDDEVEAKRTGSEITASEMETLA